MKKILSLILVFAMLFTLAACGEKKEEEAPKDRLARIQEKGVIEICTEPYFAPAEFLDPSKDGDEAYLGYDIEVMKYIAERMGVELKIVPLEFSAVLAGITDGKYDLAISAIAFTPAREEAMRMSKGYSFSTDNGGYGFVCRAEDAGKYDSIESLADAVVITQSASLQEGLYNQFCGNAKEFKLTSSMADSYLAVAEGKADVCVCPCDGAQLYSEANDNILYVSPFRFDVDPEWQSGRICACLDDDTESLIEFVNVCVDELLAEDKINEWQAYYKGVAKELGIE